MVYSEEFLKAVLIALDSDPPECMKSDAVGVTTRTRTYATIEQRDPTLYSLLIASQKNIVKQR